MEATAATSLVDGLALARLHEQRQVPFGRKKLPASTHADHAPLVAELDALVGMLDAVADALTAESVHQVVLGNPERAGASLDAVARRQVPPPELEFARTPRTGTAVTHRVALAVPAPDRLPAGWPTGDDQIRALAEPALHAWAATLLGDPRRIRADVTWVAADGAVVADSVLRLDALGIGPLDVVAMVDETGEPRPELAELLDDVAASQRPDGRAPRTRRPAELRSRSPAGRTTSAAWPRRSRWPARSATSCAAPGRSPRPTSLPPASPAPRPSTSPSCAVAPTPSSPSATRARELLTDATDAEARRIARSLGITGAIPDELDRRLDAVAALGDEPAATDDDGASSHATARIQAVLGSSFVVLPRLTGGAELAARRGRRRRALRRRRLGARGLVGASGDRAAGDRAAADGRPVRRRQRAARARSPSPSFRSPPASAGSRLPAAPGTDVVGGRTSVVLQVPAALDVTAPFAGLFVDEWVEVVPSAREVTGVACNVDEPGAQPPQAILVAVAPPNEPRWGVDVLEAILLETLDLAKLRAVTPELLSANSDVEQILPAVYVALQRARRHRVHRLLQSDGGLTWRRSPAGPGWSHAPNGSTSPTGSLPGSTTRCGSSPGSGRSASSRRRTSARRCRSACASSTAR